MFPYICITIFFQLEGVKKNALCDVDSLLDAFQSKIGKIKQRVKQDSEWLKPRLNSVMEFLQDSDRIHTTGSSDFKCHHESAHRDMLGLLLLATNFELCIKDRRVWAQKITLVFPTTSPTLCNNLYKVLASNVPPFQTVTSMTTKSTTRVDAPSSISTCPSVSSCIEDDGRDSEIARELHASLNHKRRKQNQP